LWKLEVWSFEESLLGVKRERAPRRCGPSRRVERERKRQGSEPRATRASGPTSEPTARAGARHELGSSRAEGRRKGKSQLPFCFFYGVLCKCLWEGACGLEVNLCKCCRVSRSRDNLLCAICGIELFACKYLHCLFIHVLLNVLVKCSRFASSPFL